MLLYESQQDKITHGRTQPFIVKDEAARESMAQFSSVSSDRLQHEEGDPARFCVDPLTHLQRTRIQECLQLHRGLCGES